VTAALVAYGVLMLAVGAFTARSASRSGSSFILGERNFGFIASWAALSSTTTGGTSTLVQAAWVAAKGLPGVWLELSGAIGLTFLGLWLARRVRATGATTMAEIIGRTYGPDVRKIAAALIVIAEIVWFALLTQATETVITAATPWSPTLVLCTTAAIFVIYTAAGGQHAVIGTDMIQFALMAVGIIAVGLPLALISLGNTGWPTSLLTFPTGPKFGIADIAACLVLIGLPHAVGSDVWGKLLSAKDPATAKAAALGAAGSKILFTAVVAIVALSGVALGISGGPALFPKTLLELAGPILAPLVLVAMIATMQSSSDSVLLTASAATCHDLLGGRGGTVLMRGLVVLYGLLGLGLALFMRDVVETFRLGYTLFASALILPTLISFWPKVEIHPRSAGLAMAAGAFAALAARAGLTPPGWDPVLTGTAANALTLLLGARFRVSRPARPE
jgi:SSS family solute:Na+ symporter